MAEKVTSTSDDELAKLRARVAELESALNKADYDGDRESTRRAVDSWRDISRTKRDAKNRMVRGATLASVEMVRAFAETVSSFADSVITRNEGREGEKRTVRDLATRLPGDLVTGFADAVDSLVDVPSKVADRYSKTYREGEKTS